jgi:hypothetical protein
MKSLLLILRALSPETLRALDKYMQAPYHVTHAGVLDLYKFLKKERTNPEITSELVRNALFAKELDPHKRLNHLSNYLLEAVEHFLALEVQAEQTHEQHVATVKALRHLKLNESSVAMLRYARRRLETDAMRGADYYRVDYQLNLEAYYLSLQQGRDKSTNVQDLAFAQDVALIIEKLRTGCILLSHEAVSKQSYDKGLLNSVLAFLKDHAYLEIPAIAVYYHGYYALLGEQADFHFKQLKSLLQQHGGHFSAAETHDLYLLAINYCIRRINLADEHFYREVFELYQSWLEQGALLEDGTLSRWTYNNVTMTALRLREYQWVERFLHRYASYLPEEHREAAFHFNLSRFFYDTGNYQQAMQNLLRMEYDDVLQNLAAKLLLAKIYYEQEAIGALENQLDSIQIYLRRKKVLGYHKNNYNAILRFMRKLLSVNQNDPSELRALRKLIQEEPVLTEREWMLKQLPEERIN